MNREQVVIDSTSGSKLPTYEEMLEDYIADPKENAFEAACVGMWPFPGATEIFEFDGITFSRPNGSVVSAIIPEEWIDGLASHPQVDKYIADLRMKEIKLAMKGEARYQILTRMLVMNQRGSNK